MNHIDDIRKELDILDTEMKALFIKRMALVSEVKAYKVVHKLPILDQNREQHMIAFHTQTIEDDHLKQLYKDFLIHVITLSKAYQR